MSRNSRRRLRLNSRRLLRVLIGALILALTLLAINPVGVRANHLVPITLIITEVNDIGHLDGGFFESPWGELYARVEIDGIKQDNFPDRIGCDGGIGLGCIGPPWAVHWEFIQLVPANKGTITISIEIWDYDDDDEDDKGDADPKLNDRNVDLDLNLATGQWSGDAAYPNNCAMGRIQDDDTVSVCWEIRLGTSDADSDGDGLLDSWEIHGLDYDDDGVVDIDLPGFGADPRHKDLFLELDWMTGNAPTREEIQKMKEAFANAPITAGILASELDGGINAMLNPDGRPGINLWVAAGFIFDPGAFEGPFSPAGSCVDGEDNDGDRLRDIADPDCNVPRGDNIPGGNEIPPSRISDVNSAAFYAAKVANFDRARALVFRYGISAAPGFEDGSNAGDSCMDGVDNGGNDGIDGSDNDCWPWGGGWGEIGGNDFIEYNHDGGTIMHEFGHTLNLRHGGFEDTPNCKPNYVSVMNYDHQFGITQRFRRSLDFPGVPFIFVFKSILDFSPPRFPDGRGVAPLPQLVETELDENIILDPTDPANLFVFTRAVAPSTSGLKVRGPLNQPVDWNGDMDTTDSPQSNPPIRDINIDLNDAMTGFPAACSINTELTTRDNPLEGFDDWSHISLPFNQFGDSSDGAIRSTTQPEPTLPELLRHQEALNTTDIAITKNNIPESVLLGETITYILTVHNKGLNPAIQVEVKDVLPPAVSYISNDADCTEQTGELTCDLGGLLADQTIEIRIVGRIDPGLWLTAGMPATISNTATVANLAGPDPNTANNVDRSESRVILPVVINIKPGSDVNKINLKSLIPLAVLTTRAGEYGTPLDFDATRIDPLSVRFGPRTIVWSGTGGATEVHQRGHLENAFELNEVTIDNDQDMILHFKAAHSELKVGDTEACIFGKWIDEAGNRQSFFGCASMQVIR